VGQQVQETSADLLDADLAQGDGAILLELWAPWCSPCRAMAPMLEDLAGEYAGVLRVLKLDVELYPEVGVRFAVRSIPTLILFKGGAEVARASGSRSGEQLRGWLQREGVHAPGASVAAIVADPLARGAFHGDERLKSVLHARIRVQAQAGQVLASRFPYWQGGKGSISGALTYGTSAEEFEHLTGMPFSFACALEFLCSNWTADMVDEVFGEIQPGADLHDVAARLMCNFLSDPDYDWPVLVADEAIVGLLETWLDLMHRHLDKQQPDAQQWNALAMQLAYLRSNDRDPYRTVQDHMCELLGLLSPPPSHDDAVWVNALSIYGVYLNFVIVEGQLGWSRDDFAFEGVQMHWYLARERRQPGGRFSDAALAEAHRAWQREHGALQRRHDLLQKQAVAYLPSVTSRLRAQLLQLLKDAPQVVRR